MNRTIDTNQPGSFTELAIDQLDVLHQPDLWERLAEPSVADAAALLADALPGQRVFFWLHSHPEAGTQPFLVTDVTLDPFTEHLVDQAMSLAPPALDTVGGTGVVVHDGCLQLLTSGASAEHLGALADWVRAEYPAHPGLLRLSRCQLINLVSGRVDEVIEDDGLWEGLPEPTAPGTLSEAAQILSELEHGEAFWFFATVKARWGEPTLSLLKVSDDPQGERFNHRLRTLSIDCESPLVGTGRRLGSGNLFLSAHADATGRWSALRDAIISSHSGRLPALGQLSRATLAHVAGDVVLAVSGGT